MAARQYYRSRDTPGIYYPLRCVCFRPLRRAVALGNTTDRTIEDTSDVLALSEISVNVNARQNLKCGELVNNTSSELVKLLRSSWLPPVGEHSVSICQDLLVYTRQDARSIVSHYRSMRSQICATSITAISDDSAILTFLSAEIWVDRTKHRSDQIS